MTAPQCSLCAVADGSERSRVVCEAEAWVALVPREPVTPGHTIVFPRAHVEDYWSAHPDLDRELAGAAHAVGKAIRRALRPDGLNLITSAGPAAQQTVLHLHLHLVPRWEADGWGAIWLPNGRYEGSQPEDVVRRIRTACSRD